MHSVVEDQRTIKGKSICLERPGRRNNVKAAVTSRSDRRLGKCKNR